MSELFCKRRRLWWRCVAFWLCFAAFAWIATLAVLTVGFGQKRFETPADAAIVLGAAVSSNVPSPVFAARLDHAIELYRKGMSRYVILTGGVGEGDALAESAAGAIYVEAGGVPRERILQEAVSRTTLQNLVEARRIMQAQHLRTSLLVSDPLHMRRASIMAEDLGIKSLPSPTPYSRYQTWTTQLSFLVREVYFHHHYWIFGE